MIEDLEGREGAVIVSANFQAAGGARRARRWRRGGGGGDADTPLRITRMRQNAAKVPAALEKAGIPFAFTTGGLQNPGRVRPQRRRGRLRRAGSPKTPR